MAICEWCGKNSASTHPVMSLGNRYSICDDCYKAHKDEMCIKCGSPIYGQGSIKGKCQACVQEEYEEEQRKEEEEANGVAAELLEIYSSGVEFTEEDFEQWLTFGQGNFTPERSRACRQDWLRKRLTEQGDWSLELVNANMADIEKLMERHISNVIDRKYIMVYYDGSKRVKIVQFVDRVGNIYLIDRTEN